MAGLVVLAQCTAGVGGSPSGEDPGPEGTDPRRAGPGAGGGAGAARMGDAGRPAPTNGGSGGDAGATGSPDSRGAAGADGGGSASSDAAPGPASPSWTGGYQPRPHASDFVFDEKKLSSWRLKIRPEDWKKMQDTLIAGTTPDTKQIYVPAMLRVDSEDVGQVALSYKGKWGSLMFCVQNGVVVCPKIGMKISFDEYDAEKRFHTLKKIYLHSERGDASHMRERAAYKLFRDMNIYAPRATHARVYIDNGAGEQYKGLFGLTEVVNGRATDYWFPKGQGDGNLYKEAWPGAMPAACDAAFFTARQTTNEMLVPPTRIVSFCKALVAAPPADLPRLLDAWMDTTYLARFMAVDDAINNWDGPTGFYLSGTAPHNFFFYESQVADRLYLVPWDLGNTWMPFREEYNLIPPWNKPPANCSQRWDMGGGGNNLMASPGCDRIFRGVAGSKKSVQAARDLLAGPLDLAKVNAVVDAWVAQITDAVKEDRFDTFGGYPGFQQGLARFKSDAAFARKKMEAVAAGGDVWPPVIVRPGAVTGFEAQAPVHFASVLGASNAGSSHSYALNQTAPIAGTQDARIAFEIRNTANDGASANKQFAGMRFMHDWLSVNVSKLRAVRIRIKSDQPRTVRVGFETWAYCRPKTGVVPPRFGWTVRTNAGEPQTLDVARFADLGGNPATMDTPGSVLASAGCLWVSVLPNGRDASGLLPAGRSDAGSVQVDDIELVTN